MGYIGTVGERIKVQVKLIGDYEFSTYFGYRTIDNHIYTMADEMGNIIVWKTSSYMYIEGTNEKGEYWGKAINKGDTVKISATVKAHGEYKDQEQTEVQRLKVTELVERAITKEEIEDNRRQEQIDSLKGEDFIWRMPYKQYKERYSDCETVVGSYMEDVHTGKTIEVIIREGRLKASGVRGKHYSGYVLQNEEGRQNTWRAVSEENAIRQANKEMPNHTWECVKIYHY